MTNEKILDISWGTLFKIGTAFIIFYIIYLVRDVLIWFIFALIISILLSPAIDFLQKRRIPRVVATIFIFISVFMILGTLIYLIAPIFITQIKGFVRDIPEYFSALSPFLEEIGFKVSDNFDDYTKSFQEWLAKSSERIISAVLSIFGGIFTTITILVLAILISLEERGVERMIRIFSPKKQEEEILAIWRTCQTKVAGWFGVRLLACLFVGVMSYVALRIFNIDYPFALALFAGVTNIIPAVGPIIAGVVIALIAALDSFGIAILILLIFIIIQQIESDILMPVLAKKFIGLPPALVLISLTIGGKLWGILGAILAIPLAGIIFEFTRDYLKKIKESCASSDNSSNTPQSSSSTPKKSIIW